MSVSFNSSYASDFIRENDLKGLETQVALAHKTVNDKTGLGNDFLGWVNLPFDYDKEEFARIKKAADKIRKDTDVLIVIGIGGSYLGARAAIEFLKGPYYNNLRDNAPEIYFAGNSISGSYLADMLKLCEGKRVSVNIISKSGTTTEPAVAFRVFRKYLEEQYGEQEAASRIYCTTDKARGTLKKLADEKGYECFVVPDDVGGRFSVLTAVGLLPIAAAGADIDKLMLGAQKAVEKFNKADLYDNDCYLYAALRNAFYNKGKSVELLVSYEPRFTMMAEWFKQLFGESEGKDNKGLFPASVTFSTDLHSMGQFVQDGSRLMFETVVTFGESDKDIVIEKESDDGDGLNFLAGKTMSFVNEKAFEGTVLAHTDGGVPNLVIKVDKADEENLGELIYFFEKACAISGYMLGVNPFDQPGVESYKKNMFALLGKPGYEAEKASLEARLGK
jgi:glucose-6-phosphate isomerase